MANSMNKAWEEALDARIAKVDKRNVRLQNWANWEMGGPVPKDYRKEAEEIHPVVPNPAGP